MRRGRARSAARCALWAACALSTTAAADGITGSLIAGYNRSATLLEDQGGGRSSTQVDLFTQQLRLTLDRAFFPNLRFTGGGSFDQGFGWGLPGGPGALQGRTATVHGQLVLISPFGKAIAGYVRRMDLLRGNLTTETPTLLLSWGEASRWSVSALLARPAVHDDAGTTDRVGVDAQLSTSFRAVPGLELQHVTSVNDTQDRVLATALTTVSNSVRGGYTLKLFGGRTALSTSVQLSERSVAVRRAGPDSYLDTTHPAHGALSLVEEFPATPVDSTLAGNPALVDGSLTAPAALDLGHATATRNDSRPRHLGIEFAPPFPRVNRLQVWVDRPVPLAVAITLRWAAYHSDDNVRWTEVPLAGSVGYDVFENRFDVPLQPTQKRFVKLVTSPLVPAVTTAPELAQLFVTELRALFREPVLGPSDWTHFGQATFSAAARTALPYGLVHDGSAMLTHALSTVSRGTTTYFLVNSLSYSRQLHPMLQLSARVGRHDQGQPGQHTGGFAYSTTLGATILPTLGGSVAYAGQAQWQPDGFFTTNTVSAYARAEPYRGIGLTTGATAGIQGDPVRGAVLTHTASANLTLQPNASLSAAASYGRTGTQPLGGSGVAAVAVDRVEGNVSFSPFPALHLTAGGGVGLTGDRRVPITSAALSFSPFRGGDLQLALTYSQNLDATGTVTRSFAPTLRWNIRPGALLTASYSRLDGGSAVQQVHSDQLSATLQLTL